MQYLNFSGSLTSPNDEFIQELKIRTGKDQAVRMDDNSKLSDIRTVDISNTNWIKGFLTKNNFPSRENFNDQILSMFSILIQHADLDLKFQDDCLIEIRKLVKNGLFPKMNFAMLYDRVAVAKHQKQRFGTQCRTVNGRSVVLPLEFSRSYTNKLRKKFDIIPYTLKEYEKLMNGDDSVLDKYI